MSLRDLQDELRTAAARRDVLAAKLAELRTREHLLRVERADAERAADEAATRARDLLGARASGESVDVEEAKAERDATAAHLTDVLDSVEGLGAIIEVAEGAVDRATRAAADVRMRIAVELAGPLETELRRAAHDFASALAAYHQVGETAARARFEATQEVGVQPIPIDGRAGLLISNSDGGVPAIFEQNNVSRDLRVMSRRVLSERDLLEVVFANSADEASEPAAAAQ